MKPGFNRLTMWLCCLGVLFTTASTRAFSLMGPYEAWMQPTNGFRLSGDIGGPMPIGSGYRWNVPVVTYGFDSSFLNYFGSNGVAAVESAIGVLNALPSASSLVLTNYPLLVRHVNFQAQASILTDLKSTTLSALLEQMGLTQPSRYIYNIKKSDPSLIPAGQTSTQFILPACAESQFIVGRNFDPQSLKPVDSVNGVIFVGEIVLTTDYSDYIFQYPVELFADIHPAVADDYLDAGDYYGGLTEDDVAGLAYLLSTNQIHYETLLADVIGAGNNAQSYVNGAWRQGVDKLSFLPQPVDATTSAFLTATNYFADRYLTNGIIVQQQLARVTTRPDILFTVADLDQPNSTPQIQRTGTTNWINNASFNGNLSGAGPGVIQSSITITFNRTGRNLLRYADNPTTDWYDASWASFDGTTNAPVIYPLPQPSTNFLVRLQLVMQTLDWQARQFQWLPGSAAGTVYQFQSSTNMQNWFTEFSVTNDGSICTYSVIEPPPQAEFYRLIPAGP